MKLEIIPIYKNLDDYVKSMERGEGDCDVLWEKYAVKPYWDKLEQYAPFDVSDHKLEPVKNIGKLRQ